MPSGQQRSRGRRSRRGRRRRRGRPPRSAAGRRPGRLSCGPRPADGGDREVTVGGLVVEQPLQQVQAALSQRPVVQRDAGGDHRLGEDRVGVGEPRLGPGPRRLSVGVCDGGGVVGEELRAAGVPGSTVSSSAAPIAANAIARGHGDLALAARSNWITASLRTRLTSLWAAAVPSPQSCAPAVLGGRLVRPAARAGPSGCGRRRRRTARRSGTCRALPARPFTAPGASGSRVATTSTRAMSSVQ